MTPDGMINYRNLDHYIGDVHPFYDGATKQWFLYYLLPGGTFQSRLAVSKDFLNWEEIPLTFENAPRAPYFVVAVLKHRKTYFSWFGQQYTHVCSTSEDGIHWRANPTYDIPVNKMTSPLGERDPYITFDKERNCFYEVALAYIKSPTDCAITFKKTCLSDLNQWEWLSVPLLRFPNSMLWEYGEPECPQLIKINRRWYLFASMAHRTVHHVGGLSYWVGDVDTDPEKVDWDKKPRFMLTSEDLCATQLVSHNNMFYAFGWIPQNPKGSEWGGHINSPFLVHPAPDGALHTEPDPRFWDHFSLKTRVETKAANRFEYPLPKDHVIVVRATLVGEAQTTFLFKNVPTNIYVQIDPIGKSVWIHDSANYVFASMELSLTSKKQTLAVFMVINHDILEIHLNNKASLHARLSRPITNDELVIDAPMMENLSVATVHQKEKE